MTTLVVAGLLPLLPAVALGAYNFIAMPITGIYPVVGLSMVAMVSSIYALLPALALAVVLLVRAHRRHHAHSLELFLCTFALAAFGFGAGTLGAGYWFGSNEKRLLAEAQAYCDSLLPEIERYRSEHGVYPDRLELLHTGLGRPLLLRTDDAWIRADPEHFVISINTSRGLMFNGATYDSAIGKWVP